MVLHCRRRCIAAPVLTFAKPNTALQLLYAFSKILMACIAAGDAGSAQLIPFITASTPSGFQRSIRAGVKHILVTNHLDMTKVFTEPDMDAEAEALSTAVGRVLETTTSIAVREQPHAHAQHRNSN